MEKTFCFVDGITNDEKSKKLMRRHVMKGKNAGRKIQRRSRLDVQVSRNHPRISDDQKNQIGRVHHSEWRYLSPKSLSIELGNTFFTLSLPVEVTPYSLDVINKCELCKVNI